MTATACPVTQRLIDAAQEDMAEAVSHLTRGLAIVRALDTPLRMDGLSELLKAQDDVLEKLKEYKAHIGGE